MTDNATQIRLIWELNHKTTKEPPRDKTNKMACAPSEDSDQPGHPLSLNQESWLCTHWVAKGPRFLHADSEDWSDLADAQADLSLRWAHMPLCWFCHEAAQIKQSAVKQQEVSGLSAYILKMFWCYKAPCVYTIQNLSQSMTKTIKSQRPTQTQISLRTCSLISLLYKQLKSSGSLVIHRVRRKDWAAWHMSLWGAHVLLQVLSCSGSSITINFQIWHS